VLASAKSNENFDDMNLAFIGNWNNLHLRIAVALANNLKHHHCRVAVSRNDHLRCMPILSSLSNSATNSVVEVLDAVVNFSFEKELHSSVYRIHRKMLETIEWADIVFVGAELFFLTKLIIDKPIIGVPIGFEFNKWAKSDKSPDEAYFYEAAGACDLYLSQSWGTDAKRSGSVADFFIDNKLTDRIFYFPSFPIDFDLTRLFLNGKKQTPKSKIDNRYIFYAARIEVESDQFLDNKGWPLFIAGLSLAMHRLIHHSIKLAIVVRNKKTLEILQALPTEVSELLILINHDNPGDLPYADFLHVCDQSMGVIESCGESAAGMGLTTVDALSLSSPLLTNIGLESSEDDAAANLIYDSANLREPQDVAELLIRFIDDVATAKHESFDFEKAIESSSRVISARQFALLLGEKLHELQNDFGTHVG